ncbi:MAG: SDR family NAD(P)-dependent oxidoreductase [Phycisphaerae bacterium]|nr:SDR family NAD(P)-dependent oxidoreductase [Phycisphaerae bacterium]
MKMQVSGASVIITGAGSGIGRALAVEFAANGAKVVCTGRRTQRLEQTADLIRNNGGTALAVSSDITEANQVKNLVTKTLEAFERIDVVFKQRRAL